MKDSLLRFADHFTSDEEATQLRTFNEELEQDIKGKLLWLEQKVHGHQLKIRSFFEVCPPAEISELKNQHQTLRANIERFRNDYQDTRTAFFDLLKPVLKQRISKSGNILAA